jgi:hypothetical protein
VRPEPALAEPSRSGLPSSGLAVIRIGAAIGSFIGSRRCGGTREPQSVVAAVLSDRWLADDPKARPSDRIRATELLLAYGWGKPPATAAPEGYDPLELDAMSAEAAAIVDELAQRRKGDGAST